MHKLTTLALAAILCATTMSAAELTASDLDKRRKALNDLLGEQWEYVLRTNPEFASLLGDKRFNDKSSDISLAAIERDLTATRRFLRRFEHRQVHLCDLDSYRPGPYRLDRDRQYGSTRFMAPEEFERGATIDERTMVFTLGRAAFVFLSEGQRGDNDMHLWRCRRTLYDVARAATELDPDKRFASVTEFLTAWRSA